MNIKKSNKYYLLIGHFKELLVWTVYAAVIGAVVGVVGYFFEEAVNVATEIRTSNSWLIFLLPIAGVLLVAIYRGLRIVSPKGTDRIIVEAQNGSNGIALRVAPIIIFATTISHLTGASVGREGAALQMGGSIASFIGRKIKLPYQDARTITQCGMAAGFSALFGTPVTAAIFALEVAASEIHYTSVYPVMLSSAVASIVASLLGSEGTHFELINIPEINIISLLQSMLLGLILAALAAVFVTMLEKSIHIFSAQFRNQYIKVAVGGVIVVILTFIIGNRDYNGAGMDIIRAAVSGEAVSYAFIVKMVMTALCVGCGFKGGEIVPTLFVGSTFGCVFGPLIGLSPQFSAALCMVGLFCGVTNCPVSAIFLFYELFGGQGLILAAVCCAISYTMSGDFSIYNAQSLNHPKFRSR